MRTLGILLCLSLLHAASDDDAWHALGSGTGSGSNAWGTLCIGNEVYSSGFISTIDGVSVSNIAHWNGTTWQALGTGLNGRGDDVVTDGSNIYVIGPFTMAGGIAAQHIAVWDGSSWSTLGAGLPSTPYAATFHNGELYVGGGEPAWVRKWNGASWDLIASAPANGWVYTLISYDGKLVIGGDFNNLESGSANDYLVTWDGTSLAALGAGIPYVVASLAVDADHDHLYISGQFTQAGGLPAERAARWDGSAWTALGSGLDEAAEALVFTDGKLYAFGGFSTADGNPAAHAAVWNGASWSALGAGVNGKVHSASLGSRGIVLGGEFNQAGGKAAKIVAVHKDSHRAQSSSLAAASGLPATGTLTATRANGTPLTISIISAPTQGTLTLDNPSTGAFTYTSDPGYSGSDHFLFIGSDGSGESNPALVTVSVAPDSTDPTVVITNPASSPSDLGDALTATLSGTASDNVGVVSVTYALSGATTASGAIPLGSPWTWTTPTLLAGTTTITITASDVSGNSASAVMVVTTTATALGSGSDTSTGGGSSAPCGNGAGGVALGLLLAMIALGGNGTPSRSPTRPRPPWKSPVRTFLRSEIGGQMDTGTLSDLLADLRAGDREALAVLIARTEGLVRAACVRQAPPGEVDDCVQAVFLVLARRPAAAARAPALEAWLLRVARFVCSRARRGEGRRRRHEAVAAQQAATRDQAGPDGEILGELDACLARLPERQRAAVTLRYLVGETPEAVAAALGVSQANAYQLISRGLATLRAHFQRRGFAIEATALLALLGTQAQAATTGTAASATLTAALAKTPSATAATLASGVCTAMTLSVLAHAGILVLIAAASAGAVFSAAEPNAGGASSPPTTDPATDPAKAALDGPITVSFEDTDVPDIIAFIRQVTGATILIDPQVDVAALPPVTLQAKDMKARDVLTWIERMAGLAHVEKDGAYLLTIPADANNRR